MIVLDIINAAFDRMSVIFGGTDFLAVLFKLILATLLSGCIGLERGVHRQNAGFRTYILVCIGACIAMMTNQYIVEYISGTADPARLGAQVITGVGFLGAGTIVLAGRHVVGLTTAAGLWASACLGLAIGIGYFSAAIIAAVLILVVLAFLPKFEDRVLKESKLYTMHIELQDARSFKGYIASLKEAKINIRKTTISKTPPLVAGGISFRVMLERPDDMTGDELMHILNDYEGLYILEEL
ncbi:MAG: MgtC/SapB family protein [Firmicutes bacterium]|nr:MgtC/SapB family protein [Bacillota bacterium]